MFNPLWNSLVTELNDTIYFANADYTDTLQIAELIPGLNESVLPGSPFVVANLLVKVFDQGTGHFYSVYHGK
jgi:hypothetical protein